VIAAVGYGAVLLALAGATYLTVAAWRTAAAGGADARAALRRPLAMLVVGAVLAMVALEVALLTNDFSIEYVARNHSRSTPLLFTVASAWAALEGSIVLWGLVLAGFTAWVYRRLGDTDRLGTAALAVLGVVAVFFFGLMATAANPFTTIPNPPADGLGANPLLQNHILMAVHPPLLYLGFVGMTVPFAFAIAALVLGDGTTAWLKRTRRWTLIAWSFLSLGILLGAWWSYEVLGWGGYWAWDPVENASFLPWLTATAFLHSAVVQRRRGMLQSWNVALIIATFALTILGTFITRSGVVASVHSFTQSAVGPALLGFLLVVLAGSFGLFAVRAHLVASAPRLDSLASREGAFLLNNLILTLFAAIILMGTLYPVVLEAFTGDRVTVGAPWFDRSAVPISLVLLFAMGLGPLLPYRRASGTVVWRRLRGPLQVTAVVVAVVTVAGLRAVTVLATVALATLIVTSIAASLHRAARARPGRYPADIGRVMASDPGFWGGMVAHVGVALVAVAIAFSGSFDTRETIALDVGESADFGGYTLTYVTPFQRVETNRVVVGAAISIDRGSAHLGTYEPRLNQYPNQAQAIPTPSVRTGLREDVYLSLVRIEQGTAAITLDVYRFPLVWMLWLGGLVVFAGGAWSAIAARRRRRPAEVGAGARE
jgi:cytochrome c-type biogenesis protein CcmF